MKSVDPMDGDIVLDQIIKRLKRSKGVTAAVAIVAVLVWAGDAADALSKIKRVFSSLALAWSHETPASRATRIVSQFHAVRQGDIIIHSAEWLDLRQQGAKTELLVAYRMRGDPVLVDEPPMPGVRELFSVRGGSPAILATVSGYGQIFPARYANQPYVLTLEPNGGSSGGRVLTVFFWDGVGPLIPKFSASVGAGSAVLDRGVLYVGESGRRLVLEPAGTGFRLAPYPTRLDPVAMGIQTPTGYPVFDHHILRIERCDSRLDLRFDGQPVVFSGDPPVASVSVKVGDRVFYDDNVGRSIACKLMYSRRDPLEWDESGVFQAFRFRAPGVFKLRVRSRDWWELDFAVSQRAR